MQLLHSPNEHILGIFEQMENTKAKHHSKSAETKEKLTLTFLDTTKAGNSCQSKKIISHLMAAQKNG